LIEAPSASTIRPPLRDPQGERGAEERNDFGSFYRIQRDPEHLHAPSVELIESSVRSRSRTIATDAIVPAIGNAGAFVQYVLSTDPINPSH